MLVLLKFVCLFFFCFLIYPFVGLGGVRVARILFGAVTAPHPCFLFLCFSTKHC